MRTSAESSKGWSQIYLSLADWPDRIRQVHRTHNPIRDELTFYLCFFMQGYAVRDWIIKQGMVGASEIDLAFRAMAPCDVSRYLEPLQALRHI